MHIAGLRGPFCQLARDWAYDAGLWDPLLCSWGQFFIADLPDPKPSLRFLGAIDQMYRWTRSPGFVADTRSFRWALQHVTRLP